MIKLLNIGPWKGPFIEIQAAQQVGIIIQSLGSTRFASLNFSKPDFMIYKIFSTWHFIESFIK